jgi:uncharacterized protein
MSSNTKTFSIQQNGTQPDTSHFNGLQTTGREYRNLSAMRYDIIRQTDRPVQLRDGGHLLSDVYRPDAHGKFPVLIAVSPYPRQIQDLGAPTAIIEAGNSQFFVARGYVHVIANLRGTGGSTGEWGFFDEQEREDLYDLVEWAAAQPWSNGEVGMIGISYFAITQIGAAAVTPPHLKAIFPFEVSPDLYDAAYHNGLFSASFITPWLTMLGVTAPKKDSFWRSPILNAARRVLRIPAVHRKVGSINGESARGVLQLIMKAPYAADPWDDLWRSVAVDHQVRDEYWEARNALPLLGEVDIPVYIGCDWDNVQMHLPGTFTAWKALAHNPAVRMALLPAGATTWPWESMHVEALAWFDRYLKGFDTGIDDGPRVRYWLPRAEEWRTSDTWPVPVRYEELHLGVDGVLGPNVHEGSRDYLCLGTGLNRPPRAHKSDPPSILHWQSKPHTGDVDMVGEIELKLHATSTDSDTAWMVTLRDLAPDGTTTAITGGWLRASLRAVDEAASHTGAPVLSCSEPQAVPIGEQVEYRIPLVTNAWRFKSGHRIELIITSDDQPKDVPVFAGYRHPPIGNTVRNTIHSSSTLLLPILTKGGGES